MECAECGAGRAKKMSDFGAFLAEIWAFFSESIFFFFFFLAAISFLMNKIKRVLPLNTQFFMFSMQKSHLCIILTPKIPKMAQNSLKKRNIVTFYFLTLFLKHCHFSQFLS
jgi:hypothetical protein